LLFCVRLTSEQEGVFSDLRRLVTLDLTHNNISSVEPRVFDDSANLSSLSRIFLSHNQLTELEPWPLMRAQHREITVSLAEIFTQTWQPCHSWSSNMAVRRRNCGL